ncbi:DMT family transporter [Halalkalibacterium ligniniphilum]|uniref:DMT family transporter n=1 Tax=Halalkalibacterium ligniniphilum TaxID=1134413 RepID=UPI0003486188|nr:EamA family transporter [Halalkalibacterium ligniniphilum]
MDIRRAYGFAVIGAALWGTIGLFVKKLYEHGLTPWEVVAIRVILSALILLLFIFLTNRTYLKIRLKDLPFFFGTGVVSIVFFNWCYFTVMEQSSVSLAVVLLYTGPLFVMILSRIFFKELLTKRKVAALVSTLIGCSFVVGLLPTAQVNVTPYILLAGLGSGFFYALYSIFGKYVSVRYDTLTITLYSFICASVFIFPTSGILQNATLFFDPTVLFYSLGLALFPTVIAYLFYTKGLSMIESSRAALLTTIEPVVAILLGLFVFSDSLSIWQSLGVGAVAFSILLTTETKKQKMRGQKKRAAIS